MSGKPSSPDSPAISSSAFNETSGDKRKVRTGPAALPVNGINDSGTSQRRRNRCARPVPSTGGDSRLRADGPASQCLSALPAPRPAGEAAQAKYPQGEEAHDDQGGNQ